MEAKLSTFDASAPAFVSDNVAGPSEAISTGPLDPACTLLHTDSGQSSAFNQYLPNELILIILQNALGLENPRPVTYARFSSHIFPSGRLARFLALSHELYPMVLEAFYKRNLFVCKEKADRYTRMLPPFGLYLPQPFVRHMLRRLEIALELACWFFDADEMLSNEQKSIQGDTSSKSTWDLARPITEAWHMRRAPMWVTLMRLTHEQLGFSRLEELKLKILFESTLGRNVRSEYNARFWRVVKQAGIVVRASNIVMEGWKNKIEEVMTVEAEDLQWLDTGRDL